MMLPGTVSAHSRGEPPERPVPPPTSLRASYAVPLPTYALPTLSTYALLTLSPDKLSDATSLRYLLADHV
eukprot:3271575-Rhodomonas_salina.1